jgi:2-polyprenyl-6-methoxyphenol hydroxylase-like FAD-dependent oxidoreductase
VTESGFAAHETTVSPTSTTPRRAHDEDWRRVRRKINTVTTVDPPVTLSTVRGYDSSAVPDRGSRAVVVGGSMAGLLSARVLADAYDHVVVLERDPMPDESVARRGVPQAEHAHVMLEPARVVLNSLFPGYQRELCDHGAVVIDAGAQLDYYDRGDSLAETETELPMPCASRPLFERVARRRTAETAGLTVRPECQFTGYLTDESGTAVTGVRLRNDDGEEETLFADLVVDATGRPSRTHRWLDEQNLPSPPVDNVTVDLVYSTVTVERPADETRAYLVTPSPPDARGGTAVPTEGGGLLVTLFGMHGDHPPADREGLIEFAGRLAQPEVATLLREQPWVSETVSRYPFPSSQWRHYETLDRFPDGLVVTGDAVASFNPIYGQGMSAAALDALQLHHTLAEGGRDIAPRFFNRAESHLETVWRTAVGADFEFDATAGPKPVGTDLLNRYIDRLVRSAHDDKRVSEAFARVLRLEQPPRTLFRPGVAARVLLPT